MFCVLDTPRHHFVHCSWPHRRQHIQRLTHQPKIASLATPKQQEMQPKRDGKKMSQSAPHNALSRATASKAQPQISHVRDAPGSVLPVTLEKLNVLPVKSVAQPLKRLRTRSQRKFLNQQLDVNWQGKGTISGWLERSPIKRLMKRIDWWRKIFSDECYVYLGDRHGRIFVTRRPDEEYDEECLVPTFKQSSVCIMVMRRPSNNIYFWHV